MSSTKNTAIDKVINTHEEATFFYRPMQEDGDVNGQWHAVLEAQKRGGIIQWNAQGEGRMVGGNQPGLPREWMQVHELAATLGALPCLPEFDDNWFLELFLEALDRNDFIEVVVINGERLIQLRGCDGTVSCPPGTFEDVAAYMDEEDARARRSARAKARRAARAARAALSKAAARSA